MQTRKHIIMNKLYSMENMFWFFFHTFRLNIYQKLSYIILILFLFVIAQNMWKYEEPLLDTNWKMSHLQLREPFFKFINLKKGNMRSFVIYICTVFVSLWWHLFRNAYLLMHTYCLFSSNLLKLLRTSDNA